MAAVLACSAAACGSAEAGSGPEPDAGQGDVLADGAWQDGAGDGAHEDGRASPDGPYGTGDGSQADTSPPPDGAACTLGEVFTPPCNAIAPSGPVVTSTCASGAPPAPQGGAVADGTYVLESATWYGSCPQAGTLQATLVTCGGVWNEAENVTALDAAVNLLRVNFTAAIEDASVVLNPICTTGSPMAGGAYGFSVAGTRLTTLTTYGNTVLARVYDQQ
jgi:hypothetical protein